MATIADQLALQELISQSLAPINRLSEGRLALAQGQLARSERLAQEQRAFRDREALARLEDTLIGNRSMELAKFNRTAMADAAALDSKRDRELLERRAAIEASQAETAADRADKRAILAFDRAVQEDKRQAREVLIRAAREYGIEAPESMTEAQIQTEIQNREGQITQGMARDLKSITDDINQTSSVPLDERNAYFLKALFAQPGMSQLVLKHPDIRERFNRNLQAFKKSSPYEAMNLAVQSMQREIERLPERERATAQNAFFEAANAASAESTDFVRQLEESSRRNPDIIAKLDQKKMLQEALVGRLKNVRNPQFFPRVQSSPAPRAEAPAPSGTGMLGLNDLIPEPEPMAEQGVTVQSPQSNPTEVLSPALRRPPIEQVTYGGQLDFSGPNVPLTQLWRMDYEDAVSAGFAPDQARRYATQALIKPSSTGQ